MDRIEKCLAELNYISNCLIAYRNIIASGCCNNCGQVGECKCKPDLGELVRYNCPFYMPKRTKDESD